MVLSKPREKKVNAQHLSYSISNLGLFCLHSFSVLHVSKTRLIGRQFSGCFTQSSDFFSPPRLNVPLFILSFFCFELSCYVVSVTEWALGVCRYGRKKSENTSNKISPYSPILARNHTHMSPTHLKSQFIEHILETETLLGFRILRQRKFRPEAWLSI